MSKHKMPGTLDMINRDPTEINDHIKVHFDEVIAEPDASHSADCVWRCSERCFSGSKKCCYIFLSSICGIPMALYWGCGFACITFQHVWYYTPCLRMVMVNFGCIQKYFGTCVQCCLGPVCETMGLFFSHIVVKGNR
ncbi:hypothetical protein BaRGS_00012559 [Batillaria attramentaria]|uniref:Caveolin n=1 Tax=Batillaria attramentaria TaxID=370345 RepID=A0ABD0LAJ2_9CAEN